MYPIFIIDGLMLFNPWVLNANNWELILHEFHNLKPNKNRRRNLSWRKICIIIFSKLWNSSAEQIKFSERQNYEWEAMKIVKNSQVTLSSSFLNRNDVFKFLSFECFKHFKWENISIFIIQLSSLFKLKNKT
jgi:hypothetical protein